MFKDIYGMRYEKGKWNNGKRYTPTNQGKFCKYIWHLKARNLELGLKAKKPLHTCTYTFASSKEINLSNKREFVPNQMSLFQSWNSKLSIHYPLCDLFVDILIQTITKRISRFSNDYIRLFYAQLKAN